MRSGGRNGGEGPGAFFERRGTPYDAAVDEFDCGCLRSEECCNRASSARRDSVQVKIVKWVGLRC